MNRCPLAADQETASDERRPGDAIGIVVPAFQAERHLAATLESIAAQSWRHFECVVVDDGSRDKTAAIAAERAAADARFRLVRQSNNGVSAARNTGLSSLSPLCHWVIFVDSDDLLVPDALELLRGVAIARPDAAAVSALAEYVDDAGVAYLPGRHPKIQRHRLAFGRSIRPRRLSDTEDSTWQSLLIVSGLWPPATVLIRTETVVLVGGFDERLRTQEDWDLFLRLSQHGPIAFVPVQVAWYRRHPGNASTDTAGYLHSTWYIRRKAWRDNSSRNRLMVLLSHLHFLAYLTAHNAALLRGDARSWRVRSTFAGVVWMAFLGWRTLLVVPAVPSQSMLHRLVDLDRRYRDGAFIALDA